MNLDSINKALNRPQSGSSLAFVVVMIIILLGFLGLAIYVGVISYVQQELQKATATAAQVGASASFDGDPGVTPGPTLSTDNSPATNAKKTFNAIINASPVLQYFHAQLVRDPDFVGQLVKVQSTAEIPIPLLAPLTGGAIRAMAVNASANAIYVKAVQNGFTLEPTAPSPVLTHIVNLPAPLVDGPGPDLHLVMSTTPYKGYIVEACTETACYDIGRQSQADESGFPGKTAQVSLNEKRYTAVYGGAYFDLAAKGGTVKKAAYLKIMSTGIFDSYTYQGDQVNRRIEFTPQPIIINRVELFHFGALCPNTPTCHPNIEGYALMRD